MQVHDLKAQLAASAAASEAAKVQLSVFQAEHAALQRSRASTKTRNPSVEMELEDLRYAHSLHAGLLTALCSASCTCCKLWTLPGKICAADDCSLPGSINRL